ncbi:hypothetical protein Emag_007518 [Eimeria magna]
MGAPPIEEGGPPRGLSREVTHEEFFHFHKWGGPPTSEGAPKEGETAETAAAAAGGEAAKGPWLRPRLLRCRDTAAVLLQQQVLQQQGAQLELRAAEADSNRGALWGPFIPAPHLHYSSSSGSCCCIRNGSSSSCSRSSSCSSSCSRSNFVAHLLPLRRGEWGLAECRGHFFCPSASYHLVVAEGPRQGGPPTSAAAASAAAPSIRITAFPGPAPFANDQPQQQQQQQQQHEEEGLEVASAFFEDFVGVEIGANAFRDSFDYLA